MSNYLPNHEGKIVVTLLGGSKIHLDGPFHSITISTPEGEMVIEFERVLTVPPEVQAPLVPTSQALLRTPWEDDDDDDDGDEWVPPNQDGEPWCSICKAYHGPLDE